MEIQQIPRADILDILFEGRNKDYGAYELRKTYNRRLTKALAATASACLLLIGGYTWAGRSHPSKILMPVSDEIILTKTVPEHPVVPLPIPKPQPQQIATIRSTPPLIVHDQDVRPEDVPPPNDATDQVKIGSETHAGDPFDGTVTAPSANGVGQGVIEKPKSPDEDDGIVDIVEIESAYPGGMEAWKRFLSKNYRVPEEAVSNNISGTVIVQFIVDKEGNVSDVQAISGPEELKGEAIRVIKKSGKWTPAIQNGRKVNSYKKQPIVVQLENE